MLEEQERPPLSLESWVKMSYDQEVIMLDDLLKLTWLGNAVRCDEMGLKRNGAWC